MSVPQPPPKDTLDEAEIAARQRYLVLNCVRIGGIATTIAGIAGTRDLVAIPFALAVIITLAGILAFFFAPPLLVKRWKGQDPGP
ncbi:MAG: hypothetical protein AAFR64_03905 [Pseudomonadota bacterium]